MHPILIQFGDTPIIHTFGVMVLLAVIATLATARHDAKRVGFEPEDMVSLGVEVFLAGLIGSRIFFVWLKWDTMYADEPFWHMLNLRSGGLVWYGGLLAAAPVGIWRSRAYGFPVVKACDLMATPTMLGLAIGRIGCLMAGDDHGKIWPEETWFTLRFDDPNALMADEFRGKDLLPAQPLMSLGAFTIFLILWTLRRPLATRPGCVASLLFVLYPIHRFLVEFTRGDDAARGRVEEAVPIIGGLSTSQAVSIPVVLVALGVFCYFFFRKQPDPGEAPAVAEPEGSPDAVPEAESAEE